MPRDPLKRIEVHMDGSREERLVAALREMVEAHSNQNVGLGASKRRLEAIRNARELLSTVQ